MAVMFMCMNSATASSCSEASLRFSNAQAQVKARQESLDRLKTQLVTDKKRIEELGFKTTIDTLEEWENIGIEERRLALNSLRSGWLNFAEGAGLRTIEKVALPRIKYPNKTISKLRQLGIRDDQLFDFIREFYGALGKKAQRNAWKHVVHRFGEVADIIELWPTRESGQDWSFLLEATGAVLSFGLESNHANTLVADIDFMDSFAHSLGYQLIVAPRLDDYTALSEDQLRSLSALTKLIWRDVKRLKTERDDLLRTQSNLQNAKESAQTACGPGAQSRQMDTKGNTSDCIGQDKACRASCGNIKIFGVPTVDLGCLRACDNSYRNCVKN
jgi:hypothetical protein